MNVIPIPNYAETKKIFSQIPPYGCGCGYDNYRSDIIRSDCYWYHCEHDMGMRIDFCSLTKGYECPCSDCKDYISREEVTKLIKDRSQLR